VTNYEIKFQTLVRGARIEGGRFSNQIIGVQDAIKVVLNTIIRVHGQGITHFQDEHCAGICCGIKKYGENSFELEGQEYFDRICCGCS